MSTTPTNGDSCVSLMKGTLVRPIARYPWSVATDEALKIASNQVQTTLTASVAAGDTIFRVSDASRLVVDMLLSIDSEIVSVSVISGASITVVRGFDGTMASAHNAGSALRAYIVAWHHNALAEEIKAIETALGPGLANVGGGGSPIVVVTPYNFTPQTPGGTLATGNQVITLSPVPRGVNGTDKDHYLYISGGTGTAEPVLITGGTAVSGAASGTVIVTCAYTHSGAWTIRSASAGIYEAYIDKPWRKIYIPAGHYMMYAPLKFNYAQSLTLIGDGFDYANNSGTMLDFGAHAGAPLAAISLSSGGGPGSLNVIRIQDLGLSGTFAPAGGHGISLDGVIRVCLSGVQVIGFALDGLHANNCLELTIENQCEFKYSGGWGIFITGNALTGFVVIRDSYVSWNSRSDFHGNISLYGSSAVDPMGQFTLMNVASEQAGQQPFPGVTITSAYSLFAGWMTHLCILNCDFELCVGDTMISYGPFSAIENLTEINNAFVGNQIVYSPTVKNVRSYGNKYYFTTCFRVLQSTNRVGWDIGPDAAGANSPEPTRRMLGLAGSTGAGTALLGGNSPATVLSAPYTWLEQLGPDGQKVFIPAWK